jgi:hypothetical protein
MAQLNPQLTRRTVVMIKQETTFGVDAQPSALTDGLLVMAPDFTVDATEIERDFVRNDLSPIGYRTGRIIAHCKFEMEIRGNGQEQAGLIADAPVWGRCIMACGCSQTAVPTAGFGNVGAVRDMLTNGVNSIPTTWVIGGLYTATSYNDYLITCVLAGVSGVAELRIDELNGYDSAIGTPLLMNEKINITTTSAVGTVAVVNNAASGAGSPLTPTITFSASGWNVGDIVNFNVNGFVGSYTAGVGPTGTTMAAGVAVAISALSAMFTGTTNAGNVLNVVYTGAANGVVVTSGTTALTLGSTGITVTPTWSGTMDFGHQWKVSVSPPGIAYQPISSSFPSFTIYMYMDGTLQRLTACSGTFSFAATAGQPGKFTFEMTGQYNGAQDAVLPAPILYINPLPPIFQSALLRIYSENVTISQMTFNLANTIAPRDDANSPYGYYGVRITARKPVGGIDPEATLTGDFDFWNRMAQSTYMQFSVCFGATPGSPQGVPGNSVWFKAPNAQSTKTTYKDRTGLRVYDMGVGFAREEGNDEFTILFA